MEEPPTTMGVLIPLSISLGCFVAYCMLGYMTGEFHKRIDFYNWDGLRPIQYMFWPVFWIVFVVQIFCISYNKFLDIVMDAPKKRLAKKKLKEARYKLIASKTVEELAQMIEDGKLKP
jgi:energy-converting hydrogenase Eha subunit G